MKDLLKYYIPLFSVYDIIYITQRIYSYFNIIGSIWQNRIHIYKNQAKNAYLCVCAIKEIGTTLADQLGIGYMYVCTVCSKLYSNFLLDRVHPPYCAMPRAP